MPSDAAPGLAPPPPGFSKPDLKAPLDVAAHEAMTPAAATSKALFTQSTLDALAARGLVLSPPPEKHPAFRDIPIREHNAVMIRCAQTLYPQLTLREALRELGRLAFPAFSNTLLGKVMYGVLGNRVRQIFAMASKSFEATQSHGRVVTTVVGNNAVQLSFRDTFTFLDCYHVGIMEGVFETCHVQGEVYVRDRGPGACDLFVTWSAPQPG